MEIYLARHGQDEDNEKGILNGHRDLPLTDLGRQQAEDAAALIKAKGIHFDVVLASPLKRAFETAEIISKKSGQPKPISHPLLIERDFGVMTGRPASTIALECSPDIVKTDTITYFLKPDGAETFPDLLQRARVLLNSLDETYDASDTLLLVGHGDMGKMIYAAHYDLDWKTVLKKFHFGNAELLHLSQNPVSQ